MSIGFVKVLCGILVIIIIMADEEASRGRHERNFKCLNSICIIHFTNSFRALIFFFPLCPASEAPKQ